jgi:cell division septum initiation protein DivIVA
MNSNAKKDDVVVLGGCEFKRAKNGLDETQVAPFIDDLIKERDKLAQSRDHIASLNRLAEMTVVEADKLAEQLKTEAEEQAKAESTAIVDKAKEQARQMAEQKIAEAVEAANEKARAIQTEAEEEAALMLERERTKIKSELHNLVNQQFGYMLDELESLKKQAAAVQADFDSKLAKPGAVDGAAATAIAKESDAMATRITEESDAIATRIAEESAAAAAGIAREGEKPVAEDRDAAVEEFTEERDAPVAEQEETVVAEKTEEKDATLAQQEDTAAAETAEQQDTTVAQQEETAAAEITEERQTPAAQQEDVEAAEMAEEKDAAVAQQEEAAPAEMADEKSTTVAEQSRTPVEHAEPSRAADVFEKSIDLSRLFEGGDKQDLGDPQWEVEILPPFNIGKIMEVVSFLDQLPEVENTEMIVPQIDMPSILVFLRGSVNLVDVLQTVPVVAHVEEVATDKASTNGESGKGPRKVRLSLLENTTAQEKK